MGENGWYGPWRFNYEGKLENVNAQFALVSGVAVVSLVLAGLVFFARWLLATLGWIGILYIFLGLCATWLVGAALMYPISKRRWKVDQVRKQITGAAK